MIRILKNKFLICLFLLVVSVIITSSCYAYSFAEDSTTLEEIEDYINLNLGSSYLFENGAIFVYGPDNGKRYYHYYDATNVSYLKLLETSTSSGYFYPYFYDSNDARVSVSQLDAVLIKSTSGVLSNTAISNYTISDRYVLYVSMFPNSGYTVYSSSTNAILTADGNILHQGVSKISVNVTHEFQSDTSAQVNFDYSSYGDTASVLKYSLTGIELNTDLTAPLQLRNPVVYTPRSNKFSC